MDILISLSFVIERVIRLNNNEHELDDFIDEVEPDELSLKDLEVESAEDLLDDEEDVSNVNTDDPVKMYLKDIGKIPLIDQDEEIRLAKIIETGKVANEQIEYYNEGELDLSPEDLKQLEDLVDDAAIAKNKLIEANYRLVVSIAKRYTNRGLAFLDLIQDGNMGLMRAVDKFDYEKGFKFSTYATWWIRQAITRAIADKSRTIRIPVHMVENINKMYRVTQELTQELSRTPSSEEIADRLETTADKVEYMQKIAREPLSLETKVGVEEDTSLIDFVSDTDNDTPHENLLKEMLMNALDETLETLTDREERVLRLRFGLIGGKAHTLEEVGREFGVTRERIRQIESKAMRKLRHPSRQEKLREFYK